MNNNIVIDIKQCFYQMNIVPAKAEVTVKVGATLLAAEHQLKRFFDYKINYKHLDLKENSL